MTRNRNGFTLVEMAVALLLVSVLVHMGTKNLGSTHNAYSVRAARVSFASLHARARAHAIERGQRTLLLVDPAGDSAWIRAGTVQVERLDFQQEFGVDVIAKAGPVRVCMDARGFADPDCNSYGSPVDLVFTRGAKGVGVRLLTLGQLIYP